MASEGPRQTGATLLTLTEHAQTAVRTLTQDPQAPDNAGLRITPGHEGLELMLVAEPVPGDALIEDGGARVFVEPQAAMLLDEQTLDAQVEGATSTSFSPRPTRCRRPMPLTMRLRRDTRRRVRNRCPSSGPTSLRWTHGCGPCVICGGRRPRDRRRPGTLVARAQVLMATALIVSEEILPGAHLLPL